MTAEQEQFDKNNFTLCQVESPEAAELMEFYNRAIEHNNTLPGRELRWPRFNHETMAEVIEEEWAYIVRPTDGMASEQLPPICTAMLLDSNPDPGPWPTAEGILPEKTLRFGRVAVAPELLGRHFGATVAWPLLVGHAEVEGFEAIRCEARPDPGLHRYYSETLGLTYHELVADYEDKYHPGERVTANRYAFLLVQPTEPE
jgi:hypothetical protein